jgi:hypothetical protein
VETYLDLGFVHILGLAANALASERSSLGHRVAYQVADDDLAISASSYSLSRSLLVCGTASRLGGLLHAADGCGIGRASRRAALVDSRAAAAAARTTLGRDDLIERLIELSRHLERDELMDGRVQTRSLALSSRDRRVS